MEIIIILLVVIVIILLVSFPSKSRQMRNEEKSIEMKSRLNEEMKRIIIPEQDDTLDMADRVYEASQRIKKGEAIEEILEDRKKTRAKTRNEAEDWRRNPLSVEEAKEEILKRRKRAGEGTSEEDLNEILEIWRKEGYVVAEETKDEEAGG